MAAVAFDHFFVSLFFIVFSKLKGAVCSFVLFSFFDSSFASSSARCHKTLTSFSPFCINTNSDHVPRLVVVAVAGNRFDSIAKQLKK